MTPIENPQQGENCRQGMDIQAFLKTSRDYFSHPLLAVGTREADPVVGRNSTLPRTPMNNYRKAVQSFLLAASVGFFAAGPVMADPGCDHMKGHSERHARMMEQHHTKLHDALKLSAEQEPAWAKLMASEHAGEAMPVGQTEDWTKLKAPERAEKMLEMAKARQARMAEHVSALKALYAVLTPEQQKTFEDFHSGPRERMSGKAAPKAKAADKPVPRN